MIHVTSDADWVLGSSCSSPSGCWTPEELRRSPRSNNGYVADLTHRALLAVQTHDATTVQRMPWVEDLDLLPDTGRMTP
jgi:hypothetical protein